MSDTSPIGVIGGSGFYTFLTHTQAAVPSTPFGPPSAPVAIGEVEGVPVGFLPRHGAVHQFPPHRVPYRANLWALRACAVEQVLAPCAVGSLRGDIGPGSIVVPDQLIDRTSGRVHTFYDGPGAVHVSLAQPYCPDMRELVLAAARDLGMPVVDGGTLVVVEGPRFSTAAESTWFANLGCSLVNMTAYPEVVLARELAMCYCSIALVTDYDAGVHAPVAMGPGQPGFEPVTHEEVVRVFAEHTERLKDLLRRAIPGLARRGDTRHCGCATALDDVPGGPAALQELTARPAAPPAPDQR